jgi:dolichol-phosphate mannosyltransferase
MPASDAVCVLVPTLDEGETIGDVVRDFRDAGYDVLVIDGGSTDDTQAVAREAGARVVEQSGKGKGQAVREAVREHVDAEYVLMLDGDGTYEADDAEAMLEPLWSGEAAHVIGDRFADMRPGAMTVLNRIGNRLINGAFGVIHGESFGDILSGYRAFTRDSFEEMHLTADGFGIETEMAVECAKRGIETTVVPITYYPRPAGSNTNLHPIRDGGIIFLELYRRAKTNNPLFYFGSLGTVSTATGFLVALYVGVEWVTRQVSHEVLAVVAAFAILVGVQLLMFGMLADLILSLHREQLRERE